MSTEFLSLDAITEAPSNRRPGDYRRRGADGPPYVLDPDGALTKKGGVRSLQYGRPSGFHRWIENGFALERWSERMLLVGLCRLVLSGELGEGDLAVMAEEDLGNDETIARAKHVAGADVASDRGTAAHEITHRLHDLEHAERAAVDYLTELGFDAEMIAAIEGAYSDALARWGLEVLASEIHVVDDLWRLAGTADRFVRLARDLRFGDVVIPAGTVVVLDLKTGGLRIKGGEPLYWDGYAVQLRSYAQGCRYVIDGDDERREPFEWPVEQTVGLVLHLDVGGALDTDVITATLWTVDLEHGLRLGSLACAARNAASTAGVFAQLAEGPVVRTVHETTELEELLEASLVRAWLQERIDVIGRAGGNAVRELSLRWPAGVPALRSSDAHTTDELDAIEAALDRVETDHSIPFGPSRPGATDNGRWAHRLFAEFPNTTIHETRMQ